MMEQASLDVYHIVRELSFLEGARLERIYNKGDTYYLHFYKGKEYVLKLWPGRGLYLTEKEEREQVPSNFCMLLRKYLRNKKLRKISQLDMERIVVFEIGGHKLIFEVMRPGNIILCDEDLNIIFPLHIQNFGTRWVKPRTPYQPPPPTKKLEDAKKSERKDVVRFLAVDMGFGGRFAEEICALAGVKKTKSPRELGDEEIEKIRRAIEELKEKDVRPLVMNGVVLPFPFKSMKGEGKRFETLSEAYDSLAEEKKEEREIVIDYKEHERKAKEYKEKAEYIIENFGELEEIFNALRRGISEYGWYGVDEFLEHFGRRIDSYDPEKRAVVIDGIELSLERSLGENLNLYYDLAKKYERKAERAKQVVVKKEEKPKAKKEKRREKWYEKFHWFISSEGFLVISGRNAKQNEILIRKYMEPNDLVLHADIHGSPFTLIKNGKEAGEKTIQEAAQNTVNYSKAWKMGYGAVDVFCVSPHQIGLAPPSGMYMPKGSFMIKGKKKYVKDVKPELAIGHSEGEVIAGPRSAIRKQTRHYVLIYPGDEEPEELAEEIAKILGVGAEEVIKVLPGKSRLWR
ncbi:MAG: NFACT family protein [Nanoarchaeota archaeon]|nr:NFACT family protein [Nanoarchaeota archaeon]